MEFFIGERMEPADDREFAIRIAEDVPRNDFIVLEAIGFPGINLFWIGSSVMMAGFFISVYARRNRKKVQSRRSCVLKKSVLLDWVVSDCIFHVHFHWKVHLI